MKFKGTKGAWEINRIASRNIKCNGITIANCSSGQSGDNQEEEEANAKLIASAPEMFELLKMIHLSFGGGCVITFSDKDISDIEQLLTKITE